MSELFQHVTDEDLNALASNAVAQLNIGVLSLIRKEQDIRLKASNATAAMLAGEQELRKPPVPSGVVLNLKASDDS